MCLQCFHKKHWHFSCFCYVSIRTGAVAQIAKNNRRTDTFQERLYYLIIIGKLDFSTCLSCCHKKIGILCVCSLLAEEN